MKKREAMTIILAALLTAIVTAGCASTKTVSVSFTTRPQAPDEQAVAEVLNGLITAYNDRDFDRWFAYYAPDAKIESLAACAVVSREEHRTAVTAAKYRPKAQLRMEKITMVASDRSRVEGELDLLCAWDTEVHRIRYDLIRLDGKWLIIEEKLPGELLFRLGKDQKSPPRTHRSGCAMNRLSGFFRGSASV